MKCNLESREDLISKYLMNELSDEESLHFEEHYFTCKICFDELKAAEQALSIVTKEGNNAFEVKGEKTKGSIFSLIPTFSTTAKIGFAFASLILLFVLYSVLNNKPDEVKNDQKIISLEEEKSEQKIDTSKTEADKQIKQEENLIAELSGPEFTPNPYYEEWINENVRSDNVIEKVIEPANDKKLYDDVNFRWIMKEHTPVLLSVLKNSEEKIFSAEINPQEHSEIVKTVSKATFRKSGLYYWRIEDENEVLYVGKFYFMKRK
ncbi:MAG: zf-HC2 domain-containing protein [Ignavibacteriaceae bacterium]|nr:zf-HC2 domain-containing protein [Ignavibacteriaceae bacterium]